MYYTCIQTGILLQILIYMLHTIQSTSMTITVRTFHFGSTLGVICLLAHINTIKNVVTSVIVILMIIISVYSIFTNEEFDEEFKKDLPGEAIYTVILCITGPYFTEKQLRRDFLKNKQIEVLIKEQKNLFDHLPDGLIIHSNEIANEAEGTTELSI